MHGRISKNNSNLLSIIKICSRLLLLLCLPTPARNSPRGMLMVFARMSWKSFAVIIRLIPIAWLSRLSTKSMSANGRGIRLRNFQMGRKLSMLWSLIQEQRQLFSCVRLFQLLFSSIKNSLKQQFLRRMQKCFLNWMMRKLEMATKRYCVSSVAAEIDN